MGDVSEGRQPDALALFPACVCVCVSVFTGCFLGSNGDVNQKEMSLREKDEHIEK